MLSSAMPWDFCLIFLFLGVVVPWRGRLRLERLLAMPAIGTKQKLALYGSTIIFQWILTGLVLWRARADGLTSRELGLGRPTTPGLLLWSVTGAVAFGFFQWFNLRRVGRMKGPVPDFMRKLAARILPETGLEFAPYCALALTAGVCEEFLYRGFTMAALGRAGVFLWAAVVLSSALFGLAHSYQGRSGVLGTALMGLVFGAARVAFVSLLPVVVWHASVDLVAGIAGRRFLGNVQD
jgi:membrane protease YdiL (CAAX protease family)